MQYRRLCYTCITNKDKHRDLLKYQRSGLNMHKSEKALASNETTNIIEHLLVEEKISYEEYLMLNRVISVFESEKISFKLEEK